MITIIEYMDAIIKTPVLSDGYIYHYTSVQALQGILDNEQFWATKSNFLNDKTEFNYAYKLFEEHILNNIKNTIFRSKLIAAFRSAIDKSGLRLSSLSEVLNGYYVVSFSTNPDNLLLWSEFSNLMGYNLAFRLTDFLGSFQKHSMWHGKVLYDRDAQLHCLQETLGNALTWRPDCYDAKSINDFDEHTSDAAIDYLSLDMYAFCTVYSMFFKQAAFAQEEEYRFVFSAFHEENDRIRQATKMCFRVKEDTLIPYIKIPCKLLDALQSITIGPKNNIDIALAGIACYCREKRIEVPILKSTIPLRY